MNNPTNPLFGSQLPTMFETAIEIEVAENLVLPENSDTDKSSASFKNVPTDGGPLAAIADELSELEQIEWTSQMSPAEELGNILPTDDQADVALNDEKLLAEIQAIPERMAFKIGDVAQIVGVKPYVLRYWESEFENLKPKKSKFNQRMYSRKDVEILLMIKKLLYRDRFSIEGAQIALRRLKKEVRVEKKIDSAQERLKAAQEKLHDLIGDLRELKERFY